ncbi:MAG: Amt family ammonium transporter [Verrucomicrobiales bacterium]|jgi:Amt family ammonium transporter
MLMSTALVLFMVPGLALFYGGMVRAKNVGNMLMMNMACVAIVPILWILFTYSLGNSPNVNASGDTDKSGLFGGDLIGNFEVAGLSGIAGTDLVGVAFFMTFAAITPALISGAVADRMRFGAWVAFVTLWSVLVYTPVTYWVYTGWHTELNPHALDFAGGTAIHINAGVAALVMALVLGKRRGLGEEDMSPHNLSLLLIGTGVLWFGWFGFNAGSAGAADGIAAQALINTFIAGAAGMVGWVGTEWLRDGKATVLGTASGLVAGLVAITPAAGFVTSTSSILFGLVSGLVCYFAVQLKDSLGYDDSLDVVGIHGVGGIVGGLLLGLLSSLKVNNAGANGGVDLLVSQAIAMGSVIIFSGVMTYLIAKFLDATIGLRVSDEEEFTGLDVSIHGQTVYASDNSSGQAAVQATWARTAAPWA